MSIQPATVPAIAPGSELFASTRRDSVLRAHAWTIALAAVLVVVDLFSASTPGFASWHLLVLAGWLLVWFIWFAIVAIMLMSPPEVGRTPRRMVVVPILWGLMFLLVQARIPLLVRFELSRPAFEAVVAEMSNAGAPEVVRDRSVGLYQARWVWRDGDMVGFELTDSGYGMFLDWAGFVWSDANPTPSSDLARYEHLAGHWYVAVAGW